MAAGSDDAPFWAIGPEELARRLASGRQGLSSREAAGRLARFGGNHVAERAAQGALRLLLRQFESPLVLVLVFAACVSAALREWVDAGIVVAIVVASALLGFAQEHRASTAMRQLRQRLALVARVLRDGAERDIPAASVVPGDVVLLSAGKLVPADGLVLEATDFLVSEAAITGESFPVEKRPGIVAADAPPAGRGNAVFLGSSVRSGTARMLVVHTGRATDFGAIAERLRQRAPETEFARGVRHFGQMLVRTMLVIVFAVLTANLLLGRPTIDSLLFSVALAVGLTPELLPAIVTVTLAAGARAMGRRGVILRRLEAMENLGSMDVLCTDKTGTLTTGAIAMKDALDAAGAPDREVARLAFLNAALETGIENPLDAAIVAAGQAAGMDVSGVAKIDEIPYDFMRRCLTIVVADPAAPGRHLLVTKGAFANVLERCTSLRGPGGDVPLDAGARAALDAIFRARGAEGERVLALATRSVEARPRHGREDERDMVFRGFLAFEDPPRPDAAAAIAGLAALGIRIKVVSGDNRHVTAHLARAVGLDPRSMLAGPDIAALKDEALWHLAPRTDLFVEIDPQQKERVVRALQRAGHCVGFLGDGINDAPALHAADVGISVEGAVDVARESADVVLLRPDLGVLRQGVLDGRRSFANTLKYISITTSANFGNMVSMALATPLLPFLPLAATQVLLNNFLSDIPSATIASDNVDPARLAWPQRWRMREILRFMAVFGLVSSAFDLLAFAVLLLAFGAAEAEFRTAWFLVSLLTELAVVLVLRTRGPALRGRPGALLLWTTLAAAVAAVAIPFMDGFAAAFGFVPLPATLVVASLAIVSGYVVATEMAKLALFRDDGPEGPRA